MGFVKSFEELGKMSMENLEFYDAEMLIVVWETKMEIVKRLLPPPLKPAARPLATAFVAYYPKTNFGPPYHEGALFVRAEFEGVEGNYCLAMPVTGDLAMAGGRERFGYPKKLANIEFKRSRNRIEGRIERHGLGFFQVRARMSGKPNSEEFQELITKEFGEEGTVTYNFKYFQAPEGGGFDYNPRLVREGVIFRPSVEKFGEAEVMMSPSDYDPWSEVEVVRMLGAVYSKGNNTMLKGKVVAEVDPAAFLPYILTKWDWWPASQK
jgi:acetoacetate decarboxylase